MLNADRWYVEDSNEHLLEWKRSSSKERNNDLHTTLSVDHLRQPSDKRNTFYEKSLIIQWYLVSHSLMRRNCSIHGHGNDLIRCDSWCCWLCQIQIDRSIMAICIHTTILIPTRIQWWKLIKIERLHWGEPITYFTAFQRRQTFIKVGILFLPRVKMTTTRSTHPWFRRNCGHTSHWHE